jgi:hypothetical protein
MMGIEDINAQYETTYHDTATFAKRSRILGIFFWKIYPHN